VTIRKPSALVVARVCPTGYSMGIGGERLHRHSPAMTALIPAANFTARKLADFRVDVQPGQYMLCNGWGIWDAAAGAWVAGPRDAEGVTVLAPWAFKTRKVAQLAARDGLIFSPGYQTVA